MVPTDLLPVVGAPAPVGPKSIRSESTPLRKICPPPSAASLALVETSCPARVPPEVGSFVESATVMFADPLSATPLIVLEVWSVVAVVEFPAKAREKLAAVSVPAPLRIAATDVPPYQGRT